MKKLLRKKWLFDVISALDEKEALSFTKVKNKCPKISNRVLSELLMQLSEEGVTKRVVEDDRTVKYYLAPKGKKLVLLLKKMEEMN